MKSHAPIVESADVVVLGGGPAGLMAAITAAERGRSVILLEHLDRPGRKLLATGGGRCNLTNVLEPEEIAACFGRQGRFMMPALEVLDSRGLRAFFDGLGIPTHAPDGMHVFPLSDQSSAVLGALWRRVRDLDFPVRMPIDATGLCIKNGRLCGVETSGGSIEAARVVIATGGRGYPDLGATGAGYALAAQAGLKIVDPTPALVPLVTRETWVRELAGVSLSPARVWIDLPRQPRAGLTGDVLFTHSGLSGPVILDLSGDVASLLARHGSVPLRLELVPGIPAETWLRRFDHWQEKGGAQTVRTQLDRFLPRSLVAALCSLANLSPVVRPAQVSRPARLKLAELLTALPLEITGTEGWDHAMVTRGGVSLKDVDPHTLESRNVPGLFFAGEVLDLDGPCGGFNLQWAFSSGRLAGSHA